VQVIFIDPLKGNAMRKFALLSTSPVVMLVSLLAGEPAQALNEVSFVKSTGSGTTNSSRPASELDSGLQPWRQACRDRHLGEE
jgi:hypothetical protein